MFILNFLALLNLLPGDSPTIKKLVFFDIDDVIFPPKYLILFSNSNLEKDSNLPVITKFLS